MTLNEYQKRPALTSDGRKWVQRCFVCDKTVDFIKDGKNTYVVVGELVRHRKCYPGMPM